MFRQDVRGAKETLSRHTYTDVPLPPPFPDAHVTSDDLEKLIAGPLGRSVALTVETVAQAGLRPESLSAVFLVGGSSRIPLIARLVYQRSGILPTTLDPPETVVARGALRAVAQDPLKTGGLPAQQVAAGMATTAMGRPPLGMAPAPGSADAPTMTIRPQPGVPVPVPPLNRQGPASVARAVPVARPRSRRRLAVVALVAVLVVGAVVGFLVSRHGGAGTTEAAQVNPPAGEHLISQYDYRFTTPKGWAESASNAPDLEVQRRAG